MKRLLRTPRAFLPAISAAILAGGCSSEPAPASVASPGDGEPNASESQYSVKVYFDTPDGLVRSEFRPNPPGSKPQVQEQTKQAQAVIGLPDGDGIKTFELPAGLSSYLLVMGAAVECGITDLTDGVADAFNAELAQAPWDQGAYFVFADRYTPGGPAFPSCDDVLFHEEVTMCMAGKLNDIATAVGPIVWKSLAHLPVVKVNPTDPDPPWKSAWILPPQRTADKFLLRNFAINSLAHVARIDQEKPQGLTAASCTEAYAAAAMPGNYVQADMPLLFGKAEGQKAPYFLPWGEGDANDSPPIDATTAPLMAASRLEHRARILRNAGQLLQEQINKGVYADLAGASRLKGMAGDEAAGLEYFWGVRNQATYPYNTAAHALRSVTGRWEMWPELVYTPQAAGPNDARIPATDPACAGYYAIETLPGNPVTGKPSALGKEMSARWGDRSIRGPGQQFASEMIQTAGIVIPPSAIVAQGVAAARAAVTGQLQQQTAVQAGILPGTPEFVTYNATGPGKYIAGVVDGVSDQDLVFGLERSFNAFRTVNSIDETSPLADAPLGELLSPSDSGFSPALQGLLGVADPSGVERQRATFDYFARASGALAVSQCATDSGSKVAAFQSSFVLGDVLRERLTLLRDLSQQSNPARKIASAAAAELKNWSGGRVKLSVAEASRNYLFDLQLSGLEPAELGAADAAGMVSKLKLVYGEPWAADCIAQLRTDCPADIESFAVTPDVTVGSSMDDGVTLDIHASQADWPTGYGPIPVELPNFSQQRLFLVSTTNPAAPARGKVLAALAVALPAVGRPVLTRDVVSDVQRKYIQDIVGLGPDWAGKGVRIFPSVLGQNPSYCIEGAPRDFFVPLESELTSDSDQFEDSWKHYLDLASLAANRADELGRELIQQGLNDDRDADAAREQIGEVCGDFGALDRITIEDGKVLPPPDDANVSQCFDEPKKDLVFLTNDPFAGLSDQEATIRLKTYIGCGTTLSDPDLCGRAKLTHAGLNLTQWEDPFAPPPAVSGCDEEIAFANGCGSSST